MSYEQAIRHWKNHHKDRYVQQCSGYFGDGIPCSPESTERLEMLSFEKLLSEAKNMAFPIWVVSSGGFWTLSSEKNLFSTKIDSFEDLEKFGEEYVYQRQCL